MIVNINTKHYEVRNTLSSLGRGLTKEVLEEVIRRSEIARDSCTKNDSPSTPGYIAWSTSVRIIRDLLIPLGWERNDEQNFSTIVSPDKDVAIAIATGNDGTGDETKEPNTKYARGAATQAAVDENRLLFSLLAPTLEEKAAEKRETWILLKRRVEDTVFAELSLPASMTKNGFVESWKKRIILQPMLIDSTVILEDDTTEEINIPIKRKIN